MATYTDRIVLVFPIAAKNRQAAASLQTLEISESGKEFETLVPLNPSLVNQYATEFNLGFEAEKAALASAHKAELDEKEAALTEANATIATRDATIATLSSEKSTQANQITELQASNTEKQAAIDTANATIATLQAKVAALDAIKSFNPRHLASTDVLLSRLTQKETKAFYSSTDPVVLGGQALFDEYEAEGYYVDLDDAQVQGLTGYMVQIGILESMERRAVILRDASAAEANYATV